MNSRQRIYKNSMACRILLLLGRIADERGDFSLEKAIASIEKFYPERWRFFSRPTRGHIDDLCKMGYIDRIAPGQYCIPYSTLDFMESQGLCLADKVI